MPSEPRLTYTFSRQEQAKQSFRYRIIFSRSLHASGQIFRLRHSTISVALVLEYEAVLNHAAMREASWASKMELDQVLDAVVGQARRIMPIRTKLRPTLRDPADDMVLECAVQAGADAIVTMNVRDFTPARELYRVDVIKLGELFLRLERGEMK
jgi:predicted nucleic acid-binding protein